MTRWRWMAGVAGLGLLAGNLLVWNHVRAMTHFVEGGVRTAAPEELSAMAKVRVLLTGVSIPRPVNVGEPSGAFATHRVDVGGQHVEVWVVGPERPRGEVVMFHGYGGTRSTLLPLVEPLVEEGLQVVLVDFRGSGGSDGSDTTLGVREADDVAAVLDWADTRAPELPRVAYGFSMGGAALLRAFERGPLPVEGVVVECVFDRLLTTVGHRFQRMGLPAWPGAPMLLFWGSVQQGANAFALAPVDHAERVDVPALVFAGRQDPRVWPEEAEAVASALDARFVLLDSGHELGFMVQPERWEHEVSAFVDEVLTAAAR